MRLEDGSTHHLVYGKVHDQLGRHVPHVVVEIHAMMDDNGGPRGVQVSTDREGWFQQLLPRDATSIRLLVEEQSNECHLLTPRNEGASAWDCSVRIHVKSVPKSMSIGSNLHDLHANPLQAPFDIISIALDQTPYRLLVHYGIPALLVFLFVRRIRGLYHKPTKTRPPTPPPRLHIMTTTPSNFPAALLHDVNLCYTIETPDHVTVARLRPSS